MNSDNSYNYKNWSDYKEDEPLPKLPWVNTYNNHEYNHKNTDDHRGWVTITKKKKISK